MITPFRKPAGGELLDWQKEYNSEVNKIRWMIEQVISHFKNWTIMHTDYRRRLKHLRRLSQQPSACTSTGRSENLTVRGNTRHLQPSNHIEENCGTRRDGAHSG